MAIDYNIPLATRGVEMNTPFQTLGQIGQLRAQQQQQQAGQQQEQIRAQQLEMNRRAMAGQDQAAAREQRQIALFTRETPPTPGEVYSAFGAKDGADILKGISAFKEQEFQTEAQLYDNMASTTGGLLKLPEALRPGAYQILRDKYIKMGIPAEQIAPEYSLEAVQQYQHQALTAKEQIELGQPDLMSVAPGTPVIDARDPLAGPVYTAPERPPSNLDAAILHAERQGDQAGVERYTRLKERVAAAGHAPATAQPDSEWVLRGEQPLQIRKGTAQPGDRPYSPPRSTSETAQDRQRKSRLESARGFLTRLNELREKINVKMGPEAGLTGMVRQGAAAVGMDPDVAEYERVRAAGGRALAVAIMGAQNLSDADAEAWANMLPGARIDRITAKRLTDQIGRMLEGTDISPAPQGPAPTGGGQMGDWYQEYLRRSGGAP